MLRRLFRKLPEPVPEAAAPTPVGPLASVGDRLVYAVGDIHGRLDLLNGLLAQIGADAIEARPARQPLLIFLGDYVDRGPHSRGVIDRIIDLKAEAGFEVKTLMGNHEDQMLSFLEDARHGPAWAEFGGGDTLASYGVAAPSPRAKIKDWEVAREALSAAIPTTHMTFLLSLGMSVALDDYFFAHAGVKPSIPLDDQLRRDLLWVREEFLSAPGPFGKVVVHGHTPTVKPYDGAYRIGIDTGAYATGVLTAVRLYQDTRTMLCTGRSS